jgi:hypothetical protein
MNDIAFPAFFQTHCAKFASSVTVKIQTLQNNEFGLLSHPHLLKALAGFSATRLEQMGLNALPCQHVRKNCNTFQCVCTCLGLRGRATFGQIQ